MNNSTLGFIFCVQKRGGFEKNIQKETFEYDTYPLTYKENY